MASLISLRQARARFQAGVATKLEVLEAETQLSRDRNLLTNSLRLQSRARRGLAKITNLPQDVTPTAASPSVVVGLWEPSLQESIIAAYAFREELDQFILDISINNSNANAALAAVQPVLGIYNNFAADRTEGNNFGAAEPNFYEFGWDNAVGVSATWNIFDGGRARAQYKRNKLRADQSAYEFANQRDAIRLEVEQSFYDLKANQQTIRTASREVISQREALRLSRLRFQAGVTTQREVVDNQRDLTRAQQTYVNAVADYNITIAELRRYTGLDQVVSCPERDLPADKAQPSASEEVPIEPSPIIPACEASLLGS
jgi:OMF family outer membrane factor